MRACSISYVIPFSRESLMCRLDWFPNSLWAVIVMTERQMTKRRREYLASILQRKRVTRRKDDSQVSRLDCATPLKVGSVNQSGLFPRVSIPLRPSIYGIILAAIM